MEPPREFLESIGFEDVKALLVIAALDFDTRSPRGWDFYAPMILEGLLNFFRIWRKDGETRFRRVSQFIGDVFLEAITNAARHGNHFKGVIEIGWWLGEKGVVCGIQDQGKFFYDPVNVALVESRTTLEHTGGYGCGGGMECIYQADEIKVVSGALYLMLLKTTMESWMGKPGNKEGE
jgi:hypothetical protein